MCDGMPAYAVASIAVSASELSPGFGCGWVLVPADVSGRAPPISAEVITPDCFLGGQSGKPNSFSGQPACE